MPGMVQVFKDSSLTPEASMPLYNQPFTIASSESQENMLSCISSVLQKSMGGLQSDFLKSQSTHLLFAWVFFSVAEICKKGSLC